MLIATPVIETVLRGSDKSWYERMKQNVGVRRYLEVGLGGNVRRRCLERIPFNDDRSQCTVVVSEVIPGCGDKKWCREVT